jgi:hypothetical protein
MGRMAAVDTAAFEGEIARALRLVEADLRAPAADALADPRGALLRLSKLAGGADKSLILRAAPELGPAAEGYAPRPADPLWVRVERGSASVSIAPLRAEGDRAEAIHAKARKVTVALETRPCCDAPSCKLERTAASAWIELDPSRRLLVAEAWDLARDVALAKARRVASLLARALGVPLEIDIDEKVEAAAPAAPGAGSAASSGPDADAEAAAAADPAAAPPSPLTAGEIARFGLVREGERIVLRDYASAGPRLSARRTLLTGVLLLALAALLWFQTARSLSGESRGAAVAFGALAVLVSLTSYAFLGVGRFAARYNARSTPLVALGRDRIIVAPWVSRLGSVDLRLEGRLGAAIPTAEVRGVHVVVRGGTPVIELETDHGPIDALSCERREVADLFCEAIKRSLDEVRHPSAGASARQRARAKAQAAPA